MAEHINIMENIHKKTAKLFSKIVKKSFTPPSDMTVSEWADEHRRLSAESSAETGQWRTSRTPYLKEIMDAFTDPLVRHIVFVSASQVGKSEAELNILGYIIDQDPSSVLYIHPTTIDAKEFSKLRVAPMIRDCPTLKRKVSEVKSRDSGNTILQKTYDGGIMTMCGSTEAHALASKPIRYLLADERDRWASTAGTEGDPWELAVTRQTTFYNAKSIEVSTPTIKGASPIAAAYELGTKERWCTECPNCHRFHEIRWADIHFDDERVKTGNGYTYKVTQIQYVCPECGCISDEFTMKHQPQKWIASSPSALSNGTRSFWLNAFVSPWASWESIILRFLNAKGDIRKLQVVFNTCFGELWEDRGDLQDENDLMARREDYGHREDGSDIELPVGVLRLTCGIDTQDDRFEYEVVGHGLYGETWGIKKGLIMGRPDEEQTWSHIDELLDHEFKFADGLGLYIAYTFVDEGGHFTQDVRLKCLERQSKRIFPIKGASGLDRAYTSNPKQEKILINKIHMGFCWSYIIGVDSGKRKIMDALKVKEAGEPHFCHFPRRDDYGAYYFNSLLSERLVYKEGRKQAWQWEKIPGHERNEALDCRNYAMAAFTVCPGDLEDTDRKLKETRYKMSLGKSRNDREIFVPKQEPAEEDIPMNMEVQQPANHRISMESHTQVRYNKKYYEDW